MGDSQQNVERLELPKNYLMEHDFGRPLENEREKLRMEHEQNGAQEEPE